MPLMVELGIGIDSTYRSESDKFLDENDFKVAETLGKGIAEIQRPRPDVDLKEKYASDPKPNATEKKDGHHEEEKKTELDEKAKNRNTAFAEAIRAKLNEGLNKEEEEKAEEKKKTEKPKEPEKKDKPAKHGGHDEGHGHGHGH